MSDDESGRALEIGIELREVDRISVARSLQSNCCFSNKSPLSFSFSPNAKPIQVDERLIDASEVISEQQRAKHLKNCAMALSQFNCHKVEMNNSMNMQFSINNALRIEFL